MKAPISKETAERRVVNKYHKLYKPLIELVDALQNLEPGGTLVDDVVLTQEKTKQQLRIEFTTRPISLVIKDSEREFILRVIEEHLK